jgi:hypothetical protein
VAQRVSFRLDRMTGDQNVIEALTIDYELRKVQNKLVFESRGGQGTQ